MSTSHPNWDNYSLNSDVIGWSPTPTIFPQYPSTPAAMVVSRMIIVPSSYCTHRYCSALVVVKARSLGRRSAPLRPELDPKSASIVISKAARAAPLARAISNGTNYCICPQPRRILCSLFICSRFSPLFSPRRSPDRINVPRTGVISTVSRRKMSIFISIHSKLL